MQTKISWCCKWFVMACCLAMLLAVLPPTAHAEGSDQYFLVNIPYSAFYEGEGISGVDTVTSATKVKPRAGSLVGGSYHADASGAAINGVTYPVKVSSAEALAALKAKGGTVVTDSTAPLSITLTLRGQQVTTTYTSGGQLFENPNYSYYALSEKPAFYKEAAVKGGQLAFGKTTAAVKTVAAEAKLTPGGHHADYEMTFKDSSAFVKDNNTKVYGVIVKTKDGGQFAMRHLANIWRGIEIGWNADDMALSGKTITSLTYYTSDGNFNVDINDIKVPIIAKDATLKADNATVKDATTALKADLPGGFKPAYAIDGVSVNPEGGKLPVAGLKPGTRTLTATDTSGTYAPVTTTFMITTETRPAQYAGGEAIVKKDDAADGDFSNYIANITKVCVNGKDYPATGRNAVLIIGKDGRIDLSKAGVTNPKGVKMVITSSGYPDWTLIYGETQVAKPDNHKTDDKTKGTPKASVNKAAAKRTGAAKTGDAAEPRLYAVLLVTMMGACLYLGLRARKQQH